MLSVIPTSDAQLPALAALLYAAAEEFIVPEFDADTAQRFLHDENVDKMRSVVSNGGYYAAAWWRDSLAGFVGVRGETHIVHLFVDKAFHGRGIGQLLLHYAISSIRLRVAPAAITVNASTFALAFYQRFGFVETQPKQCTNGVYYTPMQLSLLG